MACKRTGHHAIMQWMLSGMPQPHFRINHCNAQTAKPVTSQVKKGLPHVIKKINSKDTFCFMYNVEQADIAQWSKWKLFLHGAGAFGITSKVGRRDDILVVRDPFNCLASAIGAKVGGLSKMSLLLKKHLRQALGDCHYADCYVINYNRWFIESEYRAQIVKDLDLAWIDPNKRHGGVPVSANGSTFDKRKYDGRGYEMDVLNRYKLVKQAKLKKFIDPELAELSERMFGVNPF